MHSICNKLSALFKPSKQHNNPDLDYNNYINNRTKNVPTLDISNAIISLNNEDEEPPSYREVRDEGSIFYKKTMLFNGFSDTLIPKPRL